MNSYQIFPPDLTDKLKTSFIPDFPELVLSILLETFYFESVKGKDIEWKSATLAYPTVKSGEGRPSRPLKLSFVKT